MYLLFIIKSVSFYEAHADVLKKRFVCSIMCSCICFGRLYMLHIQFQSCVGAISESHFNLDFPGTHLIITFMNIKVIHAKKTSQMRLVFGVIVIFAFQRNCFPSEIWNIQEKRMEWFQYIYSAYWMYLTQSKWNRICTNVKLKLKTVHRTRSRLICIHYHIFSFIKSRVIAFSIRWYIVRA